MSISFEKMIKRLEQIVVKLEKGEASLDESLELFKEGTELSSNCLGILDDAQQKITIINETGEEEEFNV